MIKDKEAWVSMDRYSNYAASTHGQIKRWVNSGPNGKAGKILKPQLNNAGYYVVGLYQDGVCNMKLVSREVLRAFKGDPPSPYHEADHIDGNPKNNRPDNLQWLTPAENAAKKKPKGTHIMLNPKKAMDIHRLNKIFRVNMEELSRVFGVTVRAISYILTGHSYSQTYKDFYKQNPKYA